jgi:ribosomal protein S12 methylthiotransferase accessory factor YcaO
MEAPVVTYWETPAAAAEAPVDVPQVPAPTLPSLSDDEVREQLDRLAEDYIKAKAKFATAMAAVSEPRKTRHMTVEQCHARFLEMQEGVRQAYSNSLHSLHLELCRISTECARRRPGDAELQASISEVRAALGLTYSPPPVAPLPPSIPSV